MNELRELLKGNALQTIEMLVTDLKVCVNYFGDYATLNYSQLHSPRKHPLVDACRGLVVHVPSGQIVRQMFTRFYNYGEFPELQTDFFKYLPVRQFAKEDGSCIGVWWDCVADEWQIGTTSIADGSNTIMTLLREECELTFKELFLEVFKTEDFQLFDKANTYVFEICSVVNRIVTLYKDRPTLYLAAVFNNATGQEKDYSHLLETHALLNNPDICLPAMELVTSFEQVLENLKTVPELHEGFVLRNAAGARLKFKTLSYLLMHKQIGNGITRLDALKLIIQNEHHEFLAYCPELSIGFKKLENVLTSWRESLFDVYIATAELNDKEVGIALKDNPFQGLVFQMRKAKRTDQQILNALSDSKLKYWFL